MTISQLEPYLDKRELAAHYGVGVRTVERWLQEGMHSAKIVGKRKFRLSVVDPWLRRAGYIEEDV